MYYALFFEQTLSKPNRSQGPPANLERWRREGERILGTKLEEPLDLPLTASSNSFSLDLVRGVNVRASVERRAAKP